MLTLYKDEIWRVSSPAFSPISNQYLTRQLLIRERDGCPTVAKIVDCVEVDESAGKFVVKSMVG